MDSKVDVLVLMETSICFCILQSKENRFGSYTKVWIIPSPSLGCVILNK